MIHLDLLFFLAFIPIGAFAWRSRTRGRHWAGCWLLTLAPLYVPMAEDGFLAVWYALATPQIDPHAIGGTVEPHTLGHMLGAGIATIVLGVLAAWLSRRPLVRCEAWAWRWLLAIGLVVVGIGLVELLFFFGHGLPVPSGQGGGFGWPFWAAGFVAWALGLSWTRPGATGHAEKSADAAT